MTDLATGPRLAVTATAVAVAAIIGGPVAVAAAVLAFALTFAAMPLFRRYAMARPNARSSNTTPIPQGGGAALVIAALAAVAVAPVTAALPGVDSFLWIAAAAMALAIVGAVDDIRGVPVLPRLGLQMGAVLVVVAVASSGQRLFPILPHVIEIALLVVAGAWFINLTNFMDGIDGITLAGFMPLAAGAGILTAAGYGSPVAGVLAFAFVGAQAGFAFFNLPRARLFPGDAGSLPIGLIGGALLLDLAQHGAFAAAVILPAYHFCDATITLARRVARGERVWVAHRQHAYQNAVDGGWSHARVSGSVLVLNTALAALAIWCVRLPLYGQVLAVAAAFAAALALIAVFRRRTKA